MEQTVEREQALRQALKHEFISLAKQYNLQLFEKTARHIEDTEMCLVTLPCKNKDKRLMVLVAEI